VLPLSTWRGLPCLRARSWWDTDCNQAKASAMTSDLPANWMAFKKARHKAKRKHFDEHINEIVHSNLQPWDLMDWVGPRKHPPLRQSCIRVCLAHLQINCGTLSTPPSTQHWTGLLTCLYWATNGNPPPLGLGYHILLRSCWMPSWVL
jgi:hypothetical protein